MRKNFRGAVVCDTEFETSGGDYDLRPGDLPVPLCLVAYLLDENLNHVHTIKMWRDELLAAPYPPFDIHNIPFVAYSGQAELTNFKVLNWEFPTHVFDLHTAYLASSNVLLPYDPDVKRTKQRKRLSDACRAYGIEGWETLNKEQMAKDIGEGRWRDYGQDTVFAYCEEDVARSADLLRAQVRGSNRFPPIDTNRVFFWSEYSAKTVALVQAKGVPIDMYLRNLIEENKRTIIGELLRRFDPSHGDDKPIYTSEGEWSYARFEAWLVRSGIPFWPRLDSGRLDLDSDVFRMMSHFPGIEGLHALRDTINFIAKARLPIGRDSRNRPSLHPFGTTSGRNAHAKSIFNAHAGMRSLILFSPDIIGAYFDWRTQEVGIAAAESGDANLKRDYASGDYYHALARQNGITDDPDPVRWKKNLANGDIRQRMKSLSLGVNYGMSVPSLARGLNCHPLLASAWIEQHKRTYTRYWEWRADVIRKAMLARCIETSHGWPLHISTSPNPRTIGNHKMQGGGAEMLRWAAVQLCAAGIIPCMLVHDGILFEETDREKLEHAREIMLKAGRDICNGFEIGVDVDQMLIGGARYRDKRPMAQKMWNTVISTLEALGALPRSA
jgi:DNA polymerase I